MGKIWKISISILLTGCLLCGCQRAAPGPRLVTRVRVDAVHRETPLTRCYTQPEKMEVILYYLRCLEQQGRPEMDPERILGDRCRITVELANGERHIYFQRANQYLSRDLHPWQRINRTQAELLYPLLMSMPGDSPL